MKVAVSRICRKIFSRINSSLVFCVLITDLRMEMLDGKRLFVQVLDSVLSRILMCAERPAVNTGLHLLDLCLALEPQDPLILSTLLSCISALFVFLSMSPAESTTVSKMTNSNRCTV